MTKRSLAVVGCLLSGLACPVLSASPASPEDAAPLLVRVMDGEGRPVAGATVRAVPEQTDPEKPDPEIREETSAEGVARISGLPADRHSRVLVEREGYAPELRNLAADATREVRIALRPGGLLVGQVVDEKGRPVPGAEVELASSRLDDWAWERLSFQEHRARTGPAGRFRFRDLPDRQFELTIRHSEHATLVADHPVEGSATGRLGTFILRRGATLQGTVTDAAGQPVSGARIWALTQLEIGDSKEFPAPSTTTAGDGTFSIPRRQPGQDVDLWVCADGFLQEGAKVHFPEEPMQVRLRPAGSVRGRVLGPEGSPLAGAKVEASRMEEIVSMEIGFRIVTPCPWGEPATTDAEGWFHLANLWPAWYTVTARAPGLLNAEVSHVRAGGGEPVEVELRFQEGATVTGRTLDPEGNPVAGAKVWVGAESRWAEVTTQPDGSFRIEGLTAGSYKLSVQAEGYETAGLDLEVSGEIQADLVLTPEEEMERIEIRGRVLGPDGAPVEGARVFDFPQSVHSAWDGSFTLRTTAVPSGSLDIEAEKRGFAKGLATISAKAGDRVDNVEIQLETGARMTGLVTGLTADDLRDVTIYLMGGGVNLQTRADAEGRFEVGPISADDWSVVASVRGRTATAKVTTEPGQTEASVELAFPPVREVSGRVLSSGGEPLAGVKIFFSGEGDLSARASTRADGSFSAQVPEGDMTMILLHRAIRREQPLGAAREPVTGLEIRLHPGVTLRGSVLGVSPWELKAVWIESSPIQWGELDPDGGWSMQGVPPGSWTLVVSRGRTSQMRRTIEIADDPTLSELVIDLDFTAVPLPAEKEES